MDWIIQTPNELIPVEVKYTDHPTLSDARHVKIFLDEDETAKKGYLICRVNRPIALTDDITALPWQLLPSIWE